MKRIKNTFSKSFFKASVIVALFVMAFSSQNLLYAQSIQDLDNQIKNKKSETQTLESEIANFDSQIQQLSGQIQSTQNDINTTNNEIEDTQKRIKEAEEELRIQKEVLNEYLRVIYEESNTSPLELIASSNSFSDFVDRSEYLQTMQMKIKDTVAKIKELKSELETKRRKLENKASELKSFNTKLSLQNKALSDQRTAKDATLNQTNAQLADLAAKRAEMTRIFNEGGQGGGGGGYPYNKSQCGGVDPWKFYICQCTSYAAWWRYSHGNPAPANTGSGDARDWIGNARAQGFSVDTSPRPGDVMVFPNVGNHGHVAIVMALNGDGTVAVSEYNWLLDESYYYRSSVNPFNYAAVFIH